MVIVSKQPAKVTLSPSDNDGCQNHEHSTDGSGSESASGSIPSSELQTSPGPGAVRPSPGLSAV